MSDPFRYFNSSPEVIRLVVMMYVKYPLSLRNVEDLLAERGVDISQFLIQSSFSRFNDWTLKSLFGMPADHNATNDALRL